MAEMNNRKKKSNKILKWILSIVLILLVIIFVALVIKNKLDLNNAETDESVITFPYELEDGKIKIVSIFQYSGFNPDCGNEEEENIASLEVVNQSDEFCEKINIKVVMQNGEELLFEATNIPAGKKVWVFDVNNQTIGQADACKKITGTAEFGKASIMEDQVVCDVEDTTITVQNITENDLANVVVCCHCLFEDSYFGGTSYCYPVDSLLSGESTIIEADDCYMGTAEVVCIKKNK